MCKISLTSLDIFLCAHTLLLEKMNAFLLEVFMRKTALMPFFDEAFDPARVFRGFERNFYNVAQPRVKETDEAFLVSIDMPGVNASDVSIETSGDLLSVMAESKDTFDGGESMRSYSRSFSLPKNIDKEKLEAHYENGVLTLALPKIAEVKSRKIEITTGDKPKSWLSFLGIEKPREDRIDHQ